MRLSIDFQNKKNKMIISDIDGVWTDEPFPKGTDGQEFKIQCKRWRWRSNGKSRRI